MLHGQRKFCSRDAATNDGDIAVTLLEERAPSLGKLVEWFGRHAEFIKAGQGGQAPMYADIE